MTRTFGDKPIKPDQSQYPDIGTLAGSEKDVVNSPGQTVKGPVKPEIWNPSGKPTRFLQKKPGR